MARLNINQFKTALSRSVPNDTRSKILTWKFLTGRKTLEEIRQIVTSNVCTEAQFDRARQTVGNDPHHIAIYLQRYVFKQTIKAN